MTTIVVNGQGGVGKDTFVKYCLDKIYPYGISISTVDLIKMIASWCGWDGTKNLEWRKKLSDLKQFLNEWNDASWKDVKRAIRNHRRELQFEDYNPEKAVIFIHCREPKEIERYVKEYDAKAILIRRESVEGDFGNSSDDEVFNYNYDYVVFNNGSKEELDVEAEQFLEWLERNSNFKYYKNQKGRNK